MISVACENVYATGTQSRKLPIVITVGKSAILSNAKLLALASPMVCLNRAGMI